MQKSLAVRQANIKLLIPFVITLVVILLLANLMKFFHIQINLTPSMPIGLYRQLSTMTIHRGDIVAACLPKPIAKVGLENGYLSKGHCPSGTIPVLKKVIAIPHDNVQLTSQAIIVNEKRYLAPQQKTNHRGHSIKRWNRNDLYKNTLDYWLYGSHSRNKSWDSRYYGGIASHDILWVYKSFLTF